jgi:hypothetical protein
MFKLCPQCRAEFQEWVEQCPDCHVGLVSSEQPLPPPEPPSALPPARELVCVDRGDPAHLRQLAEELQTEGIPCRLDTYPPTGSEAPPDPGQGRFGLYVLPDQAPAAVAVRNALLERVVPDAEGLSAAAGTELAECPACGAALREGAGECESCGLEFPELSLEG